MYNIKPMKSEGCTRVLHKNLLMPMSHPKKEYIEKEAGDSYYDTPPDEKDLPEELPTRQVTWSQTRAPALAQGVMGIVTNALSYLLSWLHNYISGLIDIHAVI